MSVGLDALVAEFLVEGHVGVAVDGRDHGGLLAGRAELLDVGHDRLPVGMTERRVVDHDVFLLRRPSTSDRLRGSCWWCADRRSRCRPAPSASPSRPSSGSRPPESPAGSAPRRCRTRCARSPRPRTAPDRTGSPFSSLNTGSTDLRDTEVQQPNTTATLSLVISSRAFSANSGQFEAGSTTTASSFLPSRPPFLFCSSISIRTVSFSVVSLMAMVPESECRTPTLMAVVRTLATDGATRRRQQGAQKQDDRAPPHSVRPTFHGALRMGQLRGACCKMNVSRTLSQILSSDAPAVS